MPDFIPNFNQREPARIFTRRPSSFVRLFVGSLVAALSDVGEQLLVAVGGHGLADALEVDAQGLVQVTVVEGSVPLEGFRGCQLGQGWVACGHEWKAVEVLGNGFVVEASALVGQVAQGSRDTRSLTCWRSRKLKVKGSSPFMVVEPVIIFV